MGHGERGSVRLRQLGVDGQQGLLASASSFSNQHELAGRESQQMLSRPGSVALTLLPFTSTCCYFPLLLDAGISSTPPLVPSSGSLADRSATSESFGLGGSHGSQPGPDCCCTTLWDSTQLWTYISLRLSSSRRFL
eukprot:3524318-Rhodomonas_salina.1